MSNGRGEEPTADQRCIGHGEGQLHALQDVLKLPRVWSHSSDRPAGPAEQFIAVADVTALLPVGGAGAQEPTVCKTCQGSGFVAYMTHAGGAEGEGCPDCEPTDIGAPGDGQAPARHEKEDG